MLREQINRIKQEDSRKSDLVSTNTVNYTDIGFDVENNPEFRMKLIWTGPGYYVKYSWKGEVIYHRASQKEGILYRDKPNKEGIQIIDVDRYDERFKIESLLKHQLLNDFREIGIKVTQEMIDWSNDIGPNRKYCWNFFPALHVEMIVKLNKGDWRGSVWNSSHHTMVTVHPQLQKILYNF